MAELANWTQGAGAAMPVTLRDLAMPVFRERRLASLIFAGIFAGAILSILLLPCEYEAEMKMLLNRDRVDAVVTPDPNAPATAILAPLISEEDVNSEVELLKSRDLLQTVVLSCGLDSPPNTAWSRMAGRVRGALRPSANTPEARLARSVQTLADRLTVEPLKKTALIRVAYSSRDPQLSARVLQTLATLYQEKHAAVHRPAGTFRFFDDQAARYREDLAAAEARLTDFDAREGVVAPAEQRQLVLQHLSQLESEWREDQSNAYAAAERIRALRTRAAAEPQRQTTQIKNAGNAPLLAQLRSTLLGLQLKRSELLMKYEPTYPPAREIEKEIAETRDAIASAEKSPVEEITTDRPPSQDWIATELDRAEADQAQLLARAAAVNRVVRHYQEVAQELDWKGMARDDLARNVKAAEDNYLLYVHKREEARISDALDSQRIVNVSVAEAATPPALPTLHLSWLLIGGFFTAGVSSVGAALFADRINPAFRTPQELGSCLDVEVLGSIPLGSQQWAGAVTPEAEPSNQKEPS